MLNLLAFRNLYRSFPGNIPPSLYCTHSYCLLIYTLRWKENRSKAITGNEKQVGGVRFFLLIVLIALGLMGVGLMGTALLTFLGKDKFFRHRSPR